MSYQSAIGRSGGRRRPVGHAAQATGGWGKIEKARDPRRRLDGVGALLLSPFRRDWRRAGMRRDLLPPGAGRPLFDGVGLIRFIRQSNHWRTGSIALWMLAVTFLEHLFQVLRPG